jgi:hypothetical protein
MEAAPCEHEETRREDARIIAAARPFDKINSPAAAATSRRAGATSYFGVQLSLAGDGRERTRGKALPSGVVSSSDVHASSLDRNLSSPGKEAASPGGATSSPDGKAASLIGKATAPSKNAASPIRETDSANREAAFPQRKDAFPLNEAASLIGDKAVLADDLRKIGSGSGAWDG